MLCFRLNNSIVRHSVRSAAQKRNLSAARRFPPPLSGRKGVGDRALIFLTFIFLYFSSCAPKAYKNLQQTDGSAECLQKFQPKFERVLYRTSVDVVGNHLSGILLIKQMPDSTTRLLFTNEAGFKFFDFEFSKSGDFKVYSIIDKMNKESVKKTLQKDFQLILFNQPLINLKSYQFKQQKNNENYFAYNEGEDFYYYITNPDCSQLLRMERGSSTKKVLEAFAKDLKDGVPDSINIHHVNFNFEINLKRIYDNAE